MLIRSCITAICLSLGTIASAQTQNQPTPNNDPQLINVPAICEPAEKAIPQIEKFEELPLFRGVDKMQQVDGLKIAVIFNSSTNSYTTLLVFTKQQIVCILSAGVGEFIKTY